MRSATAIGISLAGAALLGIALWPRRRDELVHPTHGSDVPQPQPRPAAPVASVVTPPLTATRAPMYTTESWRPWLIPLCIKAGIPIEFMMEWLRIESGGDPCAVGNPFASFANGAYPLESGLVQLYGPDDYTATKADPAAMRAYCKPKQMLPVRDHNGVQLTNKDGSPMFAMGFPQGVTRALTLDEQAEQARAAVAKVSSDMRSAGHMLTNVGARWATTSPDFWMFVKLQHALPGLASAIRFTAKQLGHAPSGWREYATSVLSEPVLAMIQADPGMVETWNHHTDFAHELANAEKTGSVVRGAAMS